MATKMLRSAVVVAVVSLATAFYVAPAPIHPHLSTIRPQAQPTPLCHISAAASPVPAVAAAKPLLLTPGLWWSVGCERVTVESVKGVAVACMTASISLVRRHATSLIAFTIGVLVSQLIYRLQARNPKDASSTVMVRESVLVPKAKKQAQEESLFFKPPPDATTPAVEVDPKDPWGSLGAAGAAFFAAAADATLATTSAVYDIVATDDVGSGAGGAGRTGRVETGTAAVSKAESTAKEAETLREMKALVGEQLAAIESLQAQNAALQSKLSAATDREADLEARLADSGNTSGLGSVTKALKGLSGKIGGKLDD